MNRRTIGLIGAIGHHVVTDPFLRLLVGVLLLQVGTLLAFVLPGAWVAFFLPVFAPGAVFFLTGVIDTDDERVMAKAIINALVTKELHRVDLECAETAQPNTEPSEECYA